MIICIREIRFLNHPNDYWEIRTKPGNILSGSRKSLSEAWKHAFGDIPIPRMKVIMGDGLMRNCIDHYEVEMPDDMVAMREYKLRHYPSY